MFFKRRSRANSYIDNDTPQRSLSLEKHDKYEKQPDGKIDQAARHQSAPVTSPSTDEKDMYPRSQAPQDAYNHPNGAVNTMATPPLSANMKVEPMPDLLAQAFNQAIRPYTEKIEQLENQLADMQAWVEQLEQQRAEVHGWIDKRGLRPGKLIIEFLIL